MATKSRGALYRTPGQKGEWSVEDLEIDDPKEGEVLVELHAAGLCHSDQHWVAGDFEHELSPLLCGHEGAGVVQEVGPGVTALKPGDHVITSFIPSCGHCRWCMAGQGELCDRGAGMLAGAALDGTYRVRTAGGEQVAALGFTGTFAKHTVAPVESLIRFDDDIAPDKAAIVGCAVPTGWGTAVYVAGIQPGETVAIIGTGGVGMNAVQGARMAGAQNIVAIDPVAWKREKAAEFGATHAAASIEEAEGLISELTRGVMAERAVLTVGVVDGAIIDPALGLVSKGGVLAIAAVSSMHQSDAKFSILPFAMYAKQIRGGLYGTCKAQTALPMLLDLYRRGDLLLDELVTKTYSLEEINQASEDLEAGRNLRGVIVYD